MTEDRGQMTEDRGQMTEDRRQMTEACDCGFRIAEFGLERIKVQNRPRRIETFEFGIRNSECGRRRAERIACLGSGCHGQRTEIVDCGLQNEGAKLIADS